ncbi:MAG: HK97 family phage prohead protease [Nanoarchaeota archaeon]|nr:HK97 family phage prohead protease [Nanoarchaeota archaeon]
MQQINLSYSVPIKVIEAIEDTDQFIIQGTAISATVTDNQHKFLAEELELAADTLKNRPLLKDHDNLTDSVVGRVISADFDPSSESIVFKARINSTDQGIKIKELIKSGDLNTVSIGANIESMDEEDGLMIPRGIKFKELSVVAVPADDSAEFVFRGTNFNLALQEAYRNKKKKIKQYSTSSEDNKINKKEEDMEKDETVKAFEERLDSQDKKLDAQSEVLAEVLESLKAMKESDQDEKAEKEEAEKTKAEEDEKAEEALKVKATEDAEKAKADEEAKAKAEAEDESEEEDDEDVDEKSKYKIVQGYKSFTVERKYR